MNKPLSRAFSSCPFILPNYVLYCRNKVNGQILVLTAVATYAARKLLEEITGEANPSSVKGDVFDDGVIEVRCDSFMATLLNYKYTEAEREWSLPQPYDQQIAYFRNAPKSDPDAPRTGKNKPVATLVARKAEGGSVTGVMSTETPPPKTKPSAPKAADDMGQRVADLTSKGGQFDREVLIKFAKVNGVWKDEDGKLSNGLARMSVVNRLRGKIKRGEQVKW